MYNYWGKVCGISSDIPYAVPVIKSSSAREVTCFQATLNIVSSLSSVGRAIDLYYRMSDMVRTLSRQIFTDGQKKRLARLINAWSMSKDSRNWFWTYAIRRFFKNLSLSNSYSIFVVSTFMVLRNKFITIPKCLISPIDIFHYRLGIRSQYFLLDFH